MTDTTARPNLIGRIAVCSCGRDTISTPSLRAFEHRPTEVWDYWLCLGCALDLVDRAAADAARVSRS